MRPPGCEKRAGRWTSLAPQRHPFIGPHPRHPDTAAAQPRCMLFGAGHVGAALVQALGPLAVPRHLGRRARGPVPRAIVPANVTVETDRRAGRGVEQAPAHAYFLVMTHSHALDQALAEAILKPSRPALVRPDRLENQAHAVRTPPGRRAACAAPRIAQHDLPDRPARHHRQGAGRDRRVRLPRNYCSAWEDWIAARPRAARADQTES
jgi:hypothetical protein